MSNAIKDVAVKRDALDGTWFHPDVPFDFDIFEAWRAENNLEVEYVTFENTASDELRELSVTNYDAAMCAWNPPAPEGEGWICGGIYPTEDGPMSFFLRTREA